MPKNHPPPPKYQRVKSSNAGGDLDVLDFSQAFKTTQLGNTLCYANPLQDKFLKYRIDLLGRQQRTRDVMLYQNQRHFFIKQVFEKGLNADVKAGAESGGHHEGEAGGSRDSSPRISSRQGSGARVKTGVSGGSGPMVRSHTIGDLRTDDAKVTTGAHTNTLPAVPEIKISSPDHSRSLQDLRSRTFHGPLPSIRSTQGFVNYNHIRNYGPNDRMGDAAAGSDGSATPELDVAKLASGNVKKDINYYRKNRSELFPRMKTLLSNYDPTSRPDREEAGHSKSRSTATTNRTAALKMPGLTVAECYKQLGRPAGSVELVAEPTRELSFVVDKDGNIVQNRRKKSIYSKYGQMLEEQEKEEHKGDNEAAAAVPKQAMKSAQEPQTRNNIKLIQKLTTYLPQHLVGKAKDQIRQMSKVDKIEETQKRLLEQNTRRAQQAMSEEKEWTRLEKTLSVTHGINLEWKKLGPGMWIY